MNRSMKFLVAGATTVGVTLLSAGALYAAQVPAGAQNHMSGLVTAIATKFNLNTADVQKVFDEQRDQQEAQRAANMKTRLDQAVKDGKLTQAQEDLLVAKQAEMKTFMDGLKDKTPAERQAAMKTQMDAMKTWLADNKIPTGFGMPFEGPMHGKMHGHGGMQGFGKGMRGGMGR